MGDRRIRAQAATEFLLIVGIALLVLIPSTYLFYRHSQSTNDELRISQAEKIGQDIIGTAEKVYYYTDPSRIELSEVMPDGVKNITIISDQTNNINLLVIYIKSKDVYEPLVFKSNVNLNSNFRYGSGDGKSYYGDGNYGDFNLGQKKIVIEAIVINNVPTTLITFK